MTLRFLSLTLACSCWLLACAEKDPPRTYVGGDRPGGDSSTGGDSSSGDPTGDDAPGDPTAGDATLTACPPPGDTSGAEVIGTRLEDLEVQWPGTLELCNLWQENASLDQELARKVRVVLPVQERPGLAAFEAMHIGIEGALIERGPMHAERWRFPGCVAPTEVTEHQLTDTVSYTNFRHSVAYDFGSAGRLIEGASVWRNDGDIRPVVIDGDPWGDGVTFTWEDAGGDNWAMLADCTGGPSMSDAVNVISAFNGANSVTLVRYWRSAPTMAGSFPVYLLGHEAVFSDRPWQSFDTNGFWTHTYAAGHHNWFEDSVVDYTRDIRWYHDLFKPDALSAGSYEFLARLDLRGLASWSGTPAIDATFRALDTGAENTVVYDPGTEWSEVNWRPVGDSLLLSLRLGCADGEILTFGSTIDGYWLRFLTCPRGGAPGFDLDALVPVVFAYDAHHAGVQFTDTAISATTVGTDPGFEIDLGNASVRIWEQSPTLLGVDVRDGDGTELYSNMLTTRESARATTVGVDGPWDEELRANNGAGVSMSLVRRYVGLGGGNTTAYAPVRFELTFDGGTHIADAFDLLDYAWVHHNDSDSLVASDGVLHLFWRLGYDAILGSVDLVRAETTAGVEVLPETTLTRQ